MGQQRQPTKRVRSTPTQLFIAAGILVLGGIFLNATAENCTTLSTGDQLCTVNTYDGLSAQAFMIVLFVGAAVLVGVGVWQLRKQR